MEEQGKYCKICGKKLFQKNQKTSYCSVKCITEDKELIETAKTSNLSLEKLAKQFNTHRKGLSAALFDLNIRKAHANKKVCPKCGKHFYSFRNDQICCSRACVHRDVTEETKRATRRAKMNRRRAHKQNALTETADKKILKLIYQHVPEGYQVDHIIPITKGGLHHQDNLQYLPASENARKKDRLDYEPQGVIRWQDVIQLTEE